MSLTISADMSGLNDLLDKLEGDVNAAVRPAAQAAAQVLYDRVRQNVAGLGRVTGNLAASIYQVYAADESDASKATYQISWNARKAPHGHLVENGYLQRYEMGFVNGRFIGPLVRPEMRGKPRPGRRASQAQKDAYFVPREGGPVQVPAKAFVRGAQDAFSQAMDAAKAELLRRIP